MAGPAIICSHKIYVFKKINGSKLEPLLFPDMYVSEKRNTFCAFWYMDTDPHKKFSPKHFNNLSITNNCLH